MVKKKFDNSVACNLLNKVRENPTENARENSE